MKVSYRKWAATLGALVLGLVCSPSSWAGCGPSDGETNAQPAYWSSRDTAMLLQAE